MPYSASATMATSALYYSDAPVGAFLSIPMTARNSDWIKGALQAAVELEISAIPSYLCAYWSIKNPIEESSMARCQPCRRAHRGPRSLVSSMFRLVPDLVCGVRGGCETSPHVEHIGVPVAFSTVPATG